VYPQGTQKERAERALSSSEAVFSGEVAATSRHPGTATVTLRVSGSWKGPDGAMLEVKTPVGGGACGYPFKEGQEYLVYASGGRDLEVDLCGETTPLSKAGADLTVLGNGEKPKNSGDALNDTSGVVPTRAVVGMAGLAMAPSLLVMVRVVRSSS
jgi:hypothetical protein